MNYSNWINKLAVAWTTALIRHWSMLVDDIAKETPKVSEKGDGNEHRCPAVAATLFFDHV